MSKPRQLSEQNKVCQKCILYKSMCFCPCCSQCPQCCLRTECRGQTSRFLASLASHGFKSPGSLYPQKGFHLTFQTKTGSNQVPSGSKWLCKPIQKHASQRGSCKSHGNVGSGKGSGQVFPGLLQLPVPGSQTKRQMETSPRLKLFESLSQYRHLQDGNSGNNPLILEGRGVGHFAGFQRRLLPYPHSPKIKYLRFFLFQQTFQFTALPFGLATAPLEFTKIVKEVKLMAQARGIRIHQYLDDWLLRAPSPEICLQHTQTLLDLCRELGW